MRSGRGQGQTAPPQQHQAGGSQATGPSEATNALRAVSHADELRARYLDKVTRVLPDESRETMANLWVATRDGRRLALAIEVYRGHRGAPPMSLDRLVPGVLAEMPRDPWAADGNYVHRHDGTSPLGYVLYSVGPDGADDGGVRNGRTFSPEPGTDLLLVPGG